MAIIPAWGYIAVASILLLKIYEVRYGLSFSSVVVRTLGFLPADVDKAANRQDMLVIGAALSRTGTVSLKAALEQLHYKVYHGENTFGSPDAHLWASIATAPNETSRDAAVNALIDYVAMSGFNASLDCPMCIFYPQLLQRYQNAKVILTLRDSPEEWASSFLSVGKRFGPIFTAEPFAFSQVVQDMRRTNDWLMLEGFRVPPSEYRSHSPEGPFSTSMATQIYNDYIARVKDVVPAKQLLVFNVKQGWHPLCDFLGVSSGDCPSSAFPNINNRGDIEKIIVLFDCIIYLYSNRYILYSVAAAVTLIFCLKYFLALPPRESTSKKKSD